MTLISYHVLSLNTKIQWDKDTTGISPEIEPLKGLQIFTTQQSGTSPRQSA